MDLASKHWLGKGGEIGVDFFVARNSIQKAAKAGDHALGGALRCAFGGGAWTGERLQQTGYTDSRCACRWCGHPEDMYHIVWGCSRFDSGEQPEAVRASQHLKRETIIGSNRNTDILAAVSSSEGLI